MSSLLLALLLVFLALLLNLLLKNKGSQVKIAIAPLAPKGAGLIIHYRRYHSFEATIRVDKDDSGEKLYTAIYEFCFSGPNYFFIPYYRSVN
jgi:hypothetical protein